MPGYTHLDRFERDQIAELKAADHGVCAIAQTLKPHPSTISRELWRNACRQGAGDRLGIEKPAEQSGLSNGYELPGDPDWRGLSTGPPRELVLAMISL